MRRIPILCLALLLLACPLRADEKEAKAIVERAIKAQGGSEALSKALHCSRTDSGVLWSAGREVPLSSKVSLGLPGKMRWEIELDKKIKTTIVLNGDKGWQTEGGPARELSAQRVKELVEEAYVLWIATLVPLTKDGFTLSTVDDVKVDGEEAAGVKVVKKGHAETLMYFLKRNGALVRINRKVSEGGLTVEKEYLYSNYKDFDGVKLHTRELVKVNGSKWNEFTISAYTFVKKFDKGTFAKP
jgi:outer membrane lipoprotein-sorting protein